MSTSKKSPVTGVLAFASSDLAGYGHGIVVIAREKGAKSDTATFVVDVLATGVRRANRSLVPTATFLNKALPALHAQHNTVPVPPETALAILAGATAFAKKVGFVSPESYDDALELLAGVAPGNAGFAFGKNGKPHFRPMPGDREEFIESALAKLRKTCGPAGFTYDLDEFDEDVLDGDDDAGESGSGDEE